MSTWHQIRTDEAFAVLRTDPKYGLSSQEAADRLRHHGANELEEKGGKGPLRIIWEQVRESTRFVTKTLLHICSRDQMEEA